MCAKNNFIKLNEALVFKIILKKSWQKVSKN
jgi:hypothetical protein